jgi:hypothetical protein
MYAQRMFALACRHVDPTACKTCPRCQLNSSWSRATQRWRPRLPSGPQTLRSVFPSLSPTGSCMQIKRVTSQYQDECSGGQKSFSAWGTFANEVLTESLDVTRGNDLYCSACVAIGMKQETLKSRRLWSESRNALRFSWVISHVILEPRSRVWRLELSAPLLVKLTLRNDGFLPGFYVDFSVFCVKASNLKKG